MAFHTYTYLPLELLFQSVCTSTDALLFKLSSKLFQMVNALLVVEILLSSTPNQD